MDKTDDNLDSIGYLTNLTARMFVRALERRLPWGSTGPMPVYLALVDGSALPQKELARLAAVEQPTMANTLSRMERDGLIASEPDPNDGRSRLLKLTPEGRERAMLSIRAAGEVNAVALGALDSAERKAFLATLRRLIEVLEADGV